MKVLVTQSYRTLFDATDYIAHQAPLCVEFSRQEYWSGLPLPSPEDVPDPGIKPGSPALQADSLSFEPPEKPVKLSICTWVTPGLSQYGKGICTFPGSNKSKDVPTLNYNTLPSENEQDPVGLLVREAFLSPVFLYAGNRIQPPRSFLSSKGHI